MDPPALDETLTGISRWLVRDYLVRLGGHSGRYEDDLEGPGWTARLSDAEDRRVGSLRVGQVRLQLWGTPEVVAELRADLGRLLMRGGG
jgi:hypothetical protein